MKKMALPIAIEILAFAITSCSQSSETQQALKDSAPNMDSTVPDGHNSASSLDVNGEYKGTLPCADCVGIETKIVLKGDKTYVKQTIYLGKDGKVFEEKGVYSWNSEGNTITLSGIKNAPNMYFVGENKLIQLDMEGNRITGNLADKYVLHK